MLRSAFNCLVSIALLLSLPGCEKSAAEKTCAAFVERFEACHPDKTPRAALSSMHSYCAISLAYELGPGDAPDNLAQLTKLALQPCAAKKACAAINECLKNSGCSFYLTGPSDKIPKFNCMNLKLPAQDPRPAEVHKQATPASP